MKQHLLNLGPSHTMAAVNSANFFSLAEEVIKMCPYFSKEKGFDKIKEVAEISPKADSCSRQLKSCKIQRQGTG